MIMKNRYFLLRHGQTIYQTKKKKFLYPWPDFVTPLTKKGGKQIKDVAKKLKSWRIDLIYSSDFLRTRQTAEIIAKILGLKIIFDKRLRDINWGIFQNGPVRKYLKFFPSEKQRFFKRPDKGENWRDVRKRMLDFVKDMEKRYKNKTILIISHADTIWLLAGIFERLSEGELLIRRQIGNFWPDVGQFLEFTA